MHALILAGGEGTRLAADGVRTPKAWVEVAGRPQLVRLAETLRRNGCAEVTAMVRASAPAPAHVSAGLPGLLTLHTCETPSSLHTLVLGLRVVPPGPVLVVLVDTVMPTRDWQRFLAACEAGLGGGADAVIAVTPYTEDDRPLCVVCDDEGTVQTIEDRFLFGRPVTGGVYAFAPIARAAVERALQDGADRLRTFLMRLAADGYRLRAVSVPRIVDLDHLSDLADAEALLEADDA